MPKAGIITAMQRERELLSKAGMDSANSGIGKVNAAMAAQKLILERNPDFIISTGCAGAMSPELKVGDIVVASSTAYHDVWCGEGNQMGQVQGMPLLFHSNPELVRAAEKTAPVRTGLIVSGDQFFISMEEDRRILSLYPEALACDMETAAIAQVCHCYGVPFLGIRTISDVHTPETENHHAKHYEEFWDEVATRSFDLLTRIIKNL